MPLTGLWKVVRLCTSTQLLFCSVPNLSVLLSSTSLCKPARSTSRTWRELMIPYGWLSWLLIITKQKSDATQLVKTEPRDKFCRLINFLQWTRKWCLVCFCLSFLSFIITDSVENLIEKLCDFFFKYHSYREFEKIVIIWLVDEF